jgi:hypothetical protein
LCLKIAQEQAVFSTKYSKHYPVDLGLYLHNQFMAVIYTFWRIFGSAEFPKIIFREEENEWLAFT